MHMRFAALLPVAALAAVAAAAPSALEARFSSGGTSECDTGSIQCCSQTLSQSEAESTYYAILKLLGINLSNTEGLVGVGCTGTTVCSQQPVCCTDNSFNGLITVGCSPITIVG